jgi:putative ABC transport system ATP-binding protein
MHAENEEGRDAVTGHIAELRDVGKVVPTPEGDLVILKALSFRIKPGETVAITGASGSGKSTLLGLMAGLDLPSEGRIQLFGKDITQLNEDGRARLRAGRVGFVFQSFQLIPHLDALENVMLPLELEGQPDCRSRAQALLARVGLSDRLHHFPKQLSGGEQQRVAIARAFSTRPEILFADEPTGNLDALRATSIADLLFELNAQHHTTLILVTHDLRLASRCQRVIELEQGRMIQNGENV